MKNIVVVNFSFPPYPGIGGRRWAKLTKYIAKNDYTIHVICSKNPFKTISSYIKDVQSNNILLYPLPLRYPSVILNSPKSIIDKILYRFFLSYLKFAVKGNYYDKAIFWEKQLLNLVIELKERFDVKNIIVSGAPFSLLYYIAKFKKELEGVNLIGDIRDPWTWGSGYGIQTLSKKRFLFEVNMQELVLKEYHKIFLPVSSMYDYLKKIYPEYAYKYVLLPNGYDAQDIILNDIKAKYVSKGIIKMILYGTLYENAHKEFELIASYIRANEKYELHIYTEDFKYIDIFRKYGLLSTRVFYNSPLHTVQLFQELNQCDYVLMIHPNNPESNGVSTKFYEVIAARIPILFIGYDEVIINFLEENKLGLAVNLNYMNQISVDLFGYSYNSSFDIDRYSFENLVNDIVIPCLK